MPQKIIFSVEDEKKIINLYQMGMSCPKIGKLFSCSKQTINGVLTKHNIEFRDRSHGNRLYTIEENVFETIDTHEKAYWLGVLAGDGCIYAGKDGKIRNQLTLSLQEKDKEYIYKFRDFLRANRPIYTIDNGIKLDGTQSISYVLSIDNKKIVDDLKKYNVIPNKTYDMKFPNLPTIYLPSYILGLIDSDGSIYLKSHYKNKDIKLLNLSFVGPTRFVEMLQQILIDRCDISQTKLDVQKQTNFIRVMSYAGYKNIYKIVKYIYSNSNIFFVRKKKIAIDYLLTKYPNDQWLLDHRC